MSTDDHLPIGSYLTIQELSGVVQEILTRTYSLLLPDEEQPGGLFVRYLRRKAGLGLVVIYNASQILPRHHRESAASQMISLTIDEQALAGSSIRITPEQARKSPLELHPPGILRAAEIGLALQAFPIDSGLPKLAASCDTSATGPLFTHLQDTAHLFLADDSWNLLTARAIPIRYHPTSRCVLRYDLELAYHKDSKQSRILSIFGKIYTNPAQAHSLHMSMQRLYAEQLALQGSIVAGYTQQTPFLPRPLLSIDSYGVTLNEAIQPTTPGSKLYTGASVLQPRFIQGLGGKTISSELPTTELHLAAIALARLHTSQVDPGQETFRTGVDEARDVRKFAALLIDYYPGQAANIENLALALAQLLENFCPETYRPAHGAFRPIHLLYHDEAVSIVDFDGFCLADPALDVGYFLAYLRRSGLWYERQGTRAWFEAASDIFTTTYASALQELGVSPEETTSILQRSHTYAAALLFKIATRRVNRLNSPRPQELAGILREIASALCKSHH